MNYIIILFVNLILFNSSFAGPHKKVASVSPQTVNDNVSGNNSVSQPPVIANNGPITFSDIWARPSLSSSSNSAAYLKIKNNSNVNYVLIGASSIEAANNVELHQSYVDEKGVSRMVKVDKILIPAQTEVELKPGGMHIMLFDLKRNLVSGDKFAMDLYFDSLDSQTIEVEVKG